MTAGQLIRKLEELDPQADVYVLCQTGGKTEVSGVSDISDEDSDLKKYLIE